MNFATKQHEYWDDLNNISMPDKHFVNLEINAIKCQLGPGRVLDVGCGDGENTIIFSQIKGVAITGIDYSYNRIKKAKKFFPQVKFKQIDLTKKVNLGKFDYIISQRFLINLSSWSQQKKVIKKLIDCLNPKGKLILCEGSLQGDKILNQFRAKLKLKPIPMHWHNVFINDYNLIKEGFKLVDGFGGYFLLTRGIRPFFDQDLNWDCRFNRLAKKVSLPIKYSRIKVWQYIKDNETEN